MTICGLLLIAAIIMKAWPETETAQWLHCHLVERPMKLVGGLERRHLILLIVLLSMMQMVAVIGSMELVTLTAIDISFYVDAMITVSTLAALNRSRSAWRAAFAWLPSLRRSGPRPRRARRVTVRAERSGPANDDDGHGAFVRAA